MHEPSDAALPRAAPDSDLGLPPGARVLVVDDSPDLLETLAWLLKAQGAAVTVAYNGREGLRAVAKSEFDLVISDIGMPQMDGYQFVAALRAQPQTATVPVVALTAYGQPRDIQRALAAGFDGHVDKPIDFARLRDVIADLLGGPSRGPPRRSPQAI